MRPSAEGQIYRISNSYNQRTQHGNLAFIVPRVKTHGSTSYLFNGIKLWNKLPFHILMTRKCLK